jgi:hypothetical protein
VVVYQPPCPSIRVRQNLRSPKENPCGKKDGAPQGKSYRTRGEQHGGRTHDGSFLPQHPICSEGVG